MFATNLPVQPSAALVRAAAIGHRFHQRSGRRRGAALDRSQDKSAQKILHRLNLYYYPMSDRVPITIEINKEHACTSPHDW